LIPQTRFAQSGDAYLAYQVFGEGPRDIVVTMGWVSHFELMWVMRVFVGFFKRLGAWAGLFVR
jgi:hypothetical protein